MALTLCENHRHLSGDMGCWVCRAQGAEDRAEKIRKDWDQKLQQEISMHEDRPGCSAAEDVFGEHAAEALRAFRRSLERGDR